MLPVSTGYVSIFYGNYLAIKR